MSAVVEPVERVVQQGAHECAQALARLLKSPVDIDGFNSTDSAALTQTLGADAVVASFQASGGVSGTLAVVADAAGAGFIASKLGGGGGALDAHALSILAEVGNIAASAFLNGAARVVGKTCLPSVPHLAHQEGAIELALGEGSFLVAELRLATGRVGIAFQAS